VNVRGGDGVGLAVVDFGGDGPPVLFLHGLAGHAGEWSRVASRLPREFHVLALDLRGHGNSERRPADASIDAHVEDVAMVAERLSPGEPLHLIGQSVGGIVAFVTAARRPDLVRGLVVVEASPSGPHPDAAASISSWLDSWPHPFASREDAVRFFGGPPHADGWVDGLVERADGWWPRFDRKVMVAIMESAAGRAWWDERANVRCPALLVRGDAGWIPEAELTAMAGRLAGVETATVPAARHDVHLDNAAGFTDVLVRFLKRTASGTGL
jgi:pimeloyl-ACP methyl ester carboxylesterase